MRAATRRAVPAARGAHGRGNITHPPRMEPPRKRQHTELAVVESAPPSAAAPAAPSSLVLEHGHTSAITGLAFSPDGRLLASSSKDKTVALWAVAGSAVSNTLSCAGHLNAVTAVAWAPSGEAFASASADKVVALWDAETGARTRRFVGHGAIVNDVAVAGGAAGGAAPLLLASASDDGSAKVWDARAGRRAAFDVPGAAPLLAVALSADGSTVFCAGTEAVVRGFELRAGGGARAAPALELAAAADTVLSLALSRAGSHLLSFAADGGLRAWDVRPYVAGGAAARATRAFAGGAPNSFEANRVGCAWAADGDRVATGGGDKLARVWDVDSGALLAALPGHAGAVTAVAFHPDGRLATAGTDKRIFLGSAVD